MNTITLQDLTVMNGEPRVLDLRIAEALEYGKPHDIRKLIGRRLAEMERYGEVFATVAKTTPSGGRPGNEYLLNEGQALLICAISETSRSADVREQLIKTFLESRRRASDVLEIGPAYDGAGNPWSITSEAVAVTTAKLAMVREARHMWGIARAKAVWRQVGLPVPPEIVDHGKGEGFECLGHLVNVGRIAEAGYKALITACMDGDDSLFEILKAKGIWCEPENDGIVIANRHPMLDEVFDGTNWHGNNWQWALRRIPGASPAKTRKFSGKAVRGVFVPIAAMDFNTDEYQA
jgi:hypothetical protein